MRYIVYNGEYPFEQVLGFVEAPADQPEVALRKAIKEFKDNEHPVVAPDDRVQH